MSFMNAKNILSESQINKILDTLRKAGKANVADQIANKKSLQKKAIKLQQQVDKINKSNKDLERIFKKKMKVASIADYF